MSFQAQTGQTWLRIRVQRWRQAPSPGSVGGHSLGRPLPPGPGSPSRPAYVFAGNPHTVSSRIRPANDRETSRNDENGWSNESSGQEAHSTIFAGSKIGLETLSRWRHGFEYRWDYSDASSELPTPQVVGVVNTTAVGWYGVQASPHRGGGTNPPRHPNPLGRISEE
jgi:hypothetical protein